MKISACVDCATPLIGGRLRCVVCHWEHTEAVAHAAPQRFGRVVIVWMTLALAEIVVVAICGVLLVMKGCSW